MAVEARQHEATRPGAIARVSDQLGINRETLRNWVSQAEVFAEQLRSLQQPGVATTG